MLIELIACTIKWSFVSPLYVPIVGLLKYKYPHLKLAYGTFWFGIIIFYFNLITLEAMEPQNPKIWTLFFNTPPSIL